jgi:hypothetical protein
MDSTSNKSPAANLVILQKELDDATDKFIRLKNIYSEVHSLGRPMPKVVIEAEEAVKVADDNFKKCFK